MRFNRPARFTEVLYIISECLNSFKLRYTEKRMRPSQVKTYCCESIFDHGVHIFMGFVNRKIWFPMKGKFPIICVGELSSPQI